MTKQDLYNDNLADTYIVIEPKKQQVVFFPKEESQMFQTKEIGYTAPGNSDKETENNDATAFAQRATGSYLSLNSSHTATDYIGAAALTVPTIIKENFSSFSIYSLVTNSIQDLYSVGVTDKIRTIQNGLQTFKIPENILNTILTDSVEIENNNGTNIKKNYGQYYITIKPQYVKTEITSINAKSHVTYTNMTANDGGAGVPIKKRRTIYECDKTDFQNLYWEFETTGSKAGRLFGSVVEIWNSDETILKQTKVMTESDFMFGSVTPMEFVLYPDNMGYDASEILIGDVCHVYPKETYFNDIVIELNYKNPSLKLENILSFNLNDVARDIKTGTFEVFDDKGFVIDDFGIVTGNVIHRYQITSTGNLELRKRIKR